jgi:hypothetical protein
MPELERNLVGHALPRSSGTKTLSLVLGVVLSLSIVAATITTPAQAAESERTATASTAAASPITLANAAIARTQLQIRNLQIAKAIATLGTLRTYVRRAHTAAMAQIGKPPTDPESDDLPGPPAVTADLALENRVTRALVPLVNRRRRADIVAALNYTLYVTHTLRQQMLTKVTGLDPEGDGGDYADGLADTLPMYAAEVTLITNGLRTYRLTAAGRLALKRALTRSRRANATMIAAYGGGE